MLASRTQNTRALRSLALRSALLPLGLLVLASCTSAVPVRHQGRPITGDSFHQPPAFGLGDWHAGATFHPSDEARVRADEHFNRLLQSRSDHALGVNSGPVSHWQSAHAESDRASLDSARFVYFSRSPDRITYFEGQRHRSSWERSHDHWGHDPSWPHDQGHQGPVHHAPAHPWSGW